MRSSVFALILRQRPEALRLRRFPQLLDRRDPELLPDPAAGLEAGVREAEELGDTEGFAPSAWSAPRSRPPLTIWTICRIVLPIPGKSFARPSSASWAIGAPGGPGRPPGGTRAPGTAVVEPEQVGEEVELLGHIRVAREGHRHAVDDMERRSGRRIASRACSGQPLTSLKGSDSFPRDLCLPPDLQRAATWSRWSIGCGTSRRRRPRARHRRQLAGWHRRDRRSAGGRAASSPRAPPVAGRKGSGRRGLRRVPAALEL